MTEMLTYTTFRDTTVLDTDSLQKSGKSTDSLVLSGKSYRIFAEIRQIHRFFGVIRQKLQNLCRSQARLM